MLYSPRHLFFATLLLLSQALCAEEPVRLGVGEWPPYVSQGLSDKGPLSKLVVDAFAASSITSELEWLPWARALRKAEKTQLNAVFPLYKSKKREQHFLFSDPLASETTAIFHHKNTPLNWQNLQDLKPYRIGVNTDYFYSEEFSQAEQEKTLDITRVDTELQLIGMLLRGRLDIILMGKTPGEHFIQQVKDGSLLTFHPKFFAKKQMHVLFPKADPKSETRLAAFNKGLRKVKANMPRLALAY